MKKSTVFKGIGIAREERAMLDEIALYLGSATMTEAICDLLQIWPKNKELAEPPAAGRAGMMSTTISLSMSDMNRLNKLSAQYGMRSGRIIRALIRSYYTEHEQEIKAIVEASSDEPPVETEPTATQIPLPEPEQTQVSDKTVEAVEMLKDDGNFRLMLLSALGAIADALIESSERRASTLDELNQIGRQLKTLNNVAWDR